MIKLKTPEPLVSAVFIKKYFPQAPLDEIVYNFKKAVDNLKIAEKYRT